MARRRSSEVVAAPFSFEPIGPREPVAPESFYRSQSNPNIDWGNLAGAGENPNGFTSQTPNGTQHVSGNGTNERPYRWHGDADGKRWNGPVDWAKNGGTRTGE